MHIHHISKRAALGLCALLVAGSVVSAQSRDRQLQLTFAGDLMSHRWINDLDSYDTGLRDLAPSLQDSDLAFVNVEFVVDPSRPLAGFPNFNGSIEYVRAAIRVGFDVFSLANNHTMDYRIAGARATHESFILLARENQISYAGLGTAIVGTWRDHQFPPPAIRNVRGMQVGFVSVSQISNVFWSDVYRQMVVVDASNRAEFLSYLRSVDQEVDLLVVSYHGDVDDEYHLSAGDTKRRVMESFTAAGADIVWGHHPHVVQEWSYPELAGRRKLVLFSTGNLLSAQGRRLSETDPNAQSRWADTHDGYLFHVTVQIAQGDATVTELRTEPVFQRRLPGGERGFVVQPFAALMESERRPVWRSYYVSRREHLIQRAAGIESAAGAQGVAQ